MESEKGMEPLTITRATASDREWAAMLMAGTEPWITLGRGLEQCRARCNSPELLLFIGRLGIEASGFILLQDRGVAGSPYVATLAVVERFRSRGIGTRLLEFAEDFYRPRAKYLFLCVSSFNHRARALYERLGYVALAELEDYVIPGASEILMHKRLAHPLH